MRKPYTFKTRSSGIIYVQFATQPRRWRSTGQKEMRDAKVWAEEHRTDKPETALTFKQFAEGFFIPGRHKWIERKHSKNKDFASDFLSVNQGRLDNYILPYFGSYLLPAIKPRMIDDWLIELTGKYKPLSHSSKNKILITLRHILLEAKEQELIDSNPAAVIRMFSEKKKKRIPFTHEECKLLYSKTQEELLKIWLTKEWELFFRIEWNGGLRPGEVAALAWEDFYPELHGFTINKSIDSRTGKIKGIKTEKKGVKEKIAFLTVYTIKELFKLKEKRQPDQSDLIFTSINGNKIKSETSNKHFVASCDRAGITLKGRTQYSLRHTFDTDLMKKINREYVQILMGHTSYRGEYDHRTGKDLLIQLQDIVPVIEESFS